MSVGTGNNSVISGNTLMGTRHLYWILIGPSFAVLERNSVVRIVFHIGDPSVKVIPFTAL
jgi:hypothetical protein